MKINKTNFKRSMTLKERIIRKVKVCSDSGCWIWTGSLNTGGYGILGWMGKNRAAHRLSWFAHMGELPEKLFVLHRCDTPSCVNPDHLFLGTQKENIKDMMNKGRGFFPKGKHSGGYASKEKRNGEGNGRAILNINDIYEIRRAEKSQPYYMKKFGVSQSCISRIQNRKTWKAFP